MAGACMQSLCLRLMHMQQYSALMGRPTASARSTTMLTFSSICSATVLVQLNCRTTCAGKMCLTRVTVYSVSSSVSSATGLLRKSWPRLDSGGTAASCAAYSLGAAAA